MEPCGTPFTISAQSLQCGQSLTTLQSNNSNVHLTHAAWRAAVSAGVARRRPTKRGCRGGAHRQQQIVPIVGHRRTLICVGEATGSNATNLSQCAMIDSNIIHASKMCINVHLIRGQSVIKRLASTTSSSTNNVTYSH